LLTEAASCAERAEAFLLERQSLSKVGM